jgi:DivIVA domain-containing protein
MRKMRESFVARRGRQAWMDEAANLATTLYPRLLRPEGKRFAPAKRGYSIAEVDRFMDRLAAFFDKGDPLKSTQLRRLTFSAAKADKAYDEASVDAFIERAIEVLMRVE